MSVDYFNSHVYLIEYAAVIPLLIPALRAASHSGNDSTATWMCHILGPHTSGAGTAHTRLTPEYQCLWFQFKRASNFYCMAIAAEPSLPSGPPSAADWAAVSVAAALATSVTAATVVASAAVAIAVIKDDNHPCNGHDNVIVDDGLTLSCSPLVVRPVDFGDQR